MKVEHELTFIFCPPFVMHCEKFVVFESVLLAVFFSECGAVKDLKIDVHGLQLSPCPHSMKDNVFFNMNQQGSL